MISKKYATTPVIALFLIVSFTGMMLFFHFGGSSSKVIHEWLGIAFIVFGLLHALANWKPFAKYFGGLKGIAIGLMIMIPVGFMVAAPSSGQPPIKAVFMKVMKAPLPNVAALSGMDTEELAKQIQGKGYEVNSLTDSLETIAKANNKSPMELLTLVASN